MAETRAVITGGEASLICVRLVLSVAFRVKSRKLTVFGGALMTPPSLPGSGYGMEVLASLAFVKPSAASSWYRCVHRMEV